MRTVCLLLAIVGGFVAHLPQASAETVPFRIFAPTGKFGNVRCGEAVGRLSDCSFFRGPIVREDVTPFYTAENNFLFPLNAGTWFCQVGGADNCKSVLVRKEFCITKRTIQEGGAVDLIWDGAFGLEINQASCHSERFPRSSGGVLGQDGEDAATREDVDSFSLNSHAGQSVEVVLAIDGAAGAINGSATLRLLDASKSVVAQRKGELPLKLKATLPGPVRVQVSRSGAPSSFRGFYSIDVTPEGGDPDLMLLATEDVEH